VSTHAIGDRAIEWMVDTYDRAMQARPTSRLRHGIIHGNRPAAHAIEWWRVGSTTDEAGSPESSATLCRSKRP
jgi:hypothetical protein